MIGLSLEWMIDCTDLVHCGLWRPRTVLKGTYCARYPTHLEHSRRFVCMMLVVAIAMLNPYLVES